MKTATVLLVEDEAAFVEALEVALRREGFVVHSVQDGGGAPARFEEVRPDLVLLGRDASSRFRTGCVPVDSGDILRAHHHGVGT